MTQRNRVWPQGAKPGDPPISDVVVPIPAGIAERDAIRERLRTFAAGARPAAQAPSVLHDYLRYIGMHE